MMEPSPPPIYNESIDDDVEQQQQLKLQNSVTSDDPTEEAAGSKIGNFIEEKKHPSSFVGSTKTNESNDTGNPEVQVVESPVVNKDRIGTIYQMNTKGSKNKIAIVGSAPNSPNPSSHPFRGKESKTQFAIPESQLEELQKKHQDAIKEHAKEIAAADKAKHDLMVPGGKHGGDNNNEEEELTSWKDVWTSCCYHSKTEWLSICSGLFSLILCLYVFLFALELLGTSFKVVGGCTAGSLLGSDTNPLASVCVGIIATALLQSSSTTTAIIVSLVSGGLDVKQGIYLVMGANVGTSITCMMVSLSHMGDGQELESAFSGSSLLYVFNFCTICILFPLELISGYLYNFTKTMLPSSVGEGDKWEGPIKKIVSPLVKQIIMSNKDLIADISTGEVSSCDDRYPINCEDDSNPTYSTCTAGLIGCDESTGKCPALFQPGGTKRDDSISGWVCLFIALVLLIVCLIILVALLRKMLLGASTRIIYKATNINPYFGMLIGAAVTILVQSSSITSSSLVPLAGLGILHLEQMYPLIIGADIGTTITALLAAMVSSKVEALQIALVHLFFNVTGMLLWYPLPFMRNFVLKTGRKIGQITRKWRNFPLLFISNMYFVLPILILGISACFEQNAKGFVTLGIFLLVLLVLAIAYLVYWFFYLDGKAKCRTNMVNRQRKIAALKQLPDDMDYIKVDLEYIKNELIRLKDFAGAHASILAQKRHEGAHEYDASVKEEPEDEEQEQHGTTLRNRRHRHSKSEARPPSLVAIFGDDADEIGQTLFDEATRLRSYHGSAAGGGVSDYFEDSYNNIDIDDRVSLLGSVQSKSWKGVLVDAAKSVATSSVQGEQQ